MRDTGLKTHPGEFPGDLAAWRREGREDNARQLERLRRGLCLARETELTPRQREMVRLCFDRELTVSQIARELGVNPSTVCRTLKRARQRLYRCLRYGL